MSINTKSHLSTLKNTRKIINNAEIYTSINPNLYTANVFLSVFMLRSWPIWTEASGWITGKQIKYGRRDWYRCVIIYHRHTSNWRTTFAFYSSDIAPLTVYPRIPVIATADLHPVRWSHQYMYTYSFSCILTLNRRADRHVCLCTLIFFFFLDKSRNRNYSQTKVSSLGKVFLYR